jgi:hypothetical protein
MTGRRANRMVGGNTELGYVNSASLKALYLCPKCVLSPFLRDILFTST